MLAIIVPFTSGGLGRVEVRPDVMTRDRLSLKPVKFKLDSGSDFTLMKTDDLIRVLGYTRELLEACPVYDTPAKTVSSDTLRLQYIENVSIKFGERELQGCRVFFCLDRHTSNLIGCDILKYFNWSVDYDKGELVMTPRQVKPDLLQGEQEIHIYTLDEGCM
ncbi:MAG: retropepsin-like domain-containing protein [Defluviitaleaceae bacterium]|nr:retropepsin-like domain-containing protein [Defluviitaleaceae bacterium]